MTEEKKERCTFECKDEKPTEMSTDQKVDSLARAMFTFKEELKTTCISLDNIYIQLCTLLEILSKKEIINPEIWEETLTEVTDGIKKQMEQLIKDGKIPNVKDTGNNSEGSDETNGTSKIIVPDSRIIVPGQI